MPIASFYYAAVSQYNPPCWMEGLMTIPLTTLIRWMHAWSVCVTQFNSIYFFRHAPHMKFDIPCTTEKSYKI